MSGQFHDLEAFLSKEEDWLQLDSWLSESLRQILCSDKGRSLCPCKKLNSDPSVFQSVGYSSLSKMGIVISYVSLSVQNLIPFIQDGAKVTWYSMFLVLRIMLCSFWATLYKYFMDQVMKCERSTLISFIFFEEFLVNESFRQKEYLFQCISTYSFSLPVSNKYLKSFNDLLK
jgi:hypothetical protein